MIGAFALLATNLISQHTSSSQEIETSTEVRYYKKNVLSFGNAISSTDNVPRNEQGLIKIDRLGSKITLTIESNNVNRIYVGYIDTDNSQGMTFYCQIGKTLARVDYRHDAFLKITRMLEPREVTYFYIKPTI